MGVFKLFSGLLSYPDAIIIIAFVFLLDIVILIKIDKLEKAVAFIETKTKELDEKVSKLEIEDESLNEEKDIIDKFLSNKGFDIIETIKDKSSNKSAKEIMGSPKISNLLNPKESKEEEDN